MKCDEIFAALALLEKERNIPQNFMMEKIVQALTTAYKKDHEGVENVIVDVDEARQDLKMYVQKEIVENVEFPGTQISLEEARVVTGRAEVGGVLNLPVDNVEFGRIAAGNGKQVIIQGLREAERGMVYEEFNSSPGSTPGPGTSPSASAPGRRAPRPFWPPASRSPRRSWPTGIG